MVEGVTMAEKGAVEREDDVAQDLSSRLTTLSLLMISDFVFSQILAITK